MAEHHLGRPAIAVDDYLNWLTTECGYIAVQPLPDNKHWVAIRKKMFTWSIEKGRVGDMHGTEDCWCYPSFAEAVTRLLQWLANRGENEPEGWIRHPGTGRRVAGPEGAIDENGKLIAPGEIYVRR